MTAEFHWCEPPWLHCKCCGGTIDPERADCILCKSCTRRCAAWVRNQEQFKHKDKHPYEGEGWSVDELPYDDPRVVAHLEDLDEYMALRRRFNEGRFTAEEIVAWLAWMLSTAKGREWLNALP